MINLRRSSSSFCSLLQEQSSQLATEISCKRANWLQSSQMRQCIWESRFTAHYIIFKISSLHEIGGIVLLSVIDRRPDHLSIPHVHFYLKMVRLVCLSFVVGIGHVLNVCYCCCCCCRRLYQTQLGLCSRTR